MDRWLSADDRLTNRHKTGLRPFAHARTLDEVVAVDAARDGSPLHAACHELKERHLSRGVLHGDAVGPQPGGK